MPTDTQKERSPEPTDEEIVETAAKAAEGFVLSQYKQSRITDLDVTVEFSGGTLDVDVYLNAPAEPDDPDPDRVVEQAVEAATEAVDELFAASGSEAGASSTGEPGAQEESPVDGDANDR
ncbi:DUF3194 domain-containing protein [Halobacteriales archaeon QS_3_64_16]|nr:MAG: DUF3194 domain-containing protein [Halobacteriales archaeon QS_3_64_16]